MYIVNIYEKDKYKYTDINYCEDFDYCDKLIVENLSSFWLECEEYTIRLPSNFPQYGKDGTLMTDENTVQVSTIINYGIDCIIRTGLDPYCPAVCTAEDRKTFYDNCGDKSHIYYEGESIEELLQYAENDLCDELKNIEIKLI